MSGPHVSLDPTAGDPLDAGWDRIQRQIEAEDAAYQAGILVGRSVRRGGLVALAGAMLALGILVGVLVSATTAHAAPRSGQTTERFDVSPPSSAALSGAPSDPAISSVGRARRDGIPLGGVAGSNPAGGANGGAPLSHGRSGVIAYATIGGPGYLAIPIGPGHLVEICGPAACWTTVSTDAGPNHERLVAGRIADVAVGQWERICGVSRIRGTCVGSWRLAGAGPTPPPTDVEALP